MPFANKNISRRINIGYQEHEESKEPEIDDLNLNQIQDAIDQINDQKIDNKLIKNDRDHKHEFPLSADQMIYAANLGNKKVDREMKQLL